MKKAEAFAHFGTKPKNTLWSWSGRSADGQKFVGTFWQDQIKKKDGQFVIDRPGSDEIEIKSLVFPNG
ncbi:MAG: hypothetical protein JO288_16705 [Hyphomicrobiales bacterium]|nr:hypothetical protein [Hyphomicrobiales bacterium]